MSVLQVMIDCVMIHDVSKDMIIKNWLVEALLGALAAGVMGGDCCFVG